MNRSSRLRLALTGIALSIAPIFCHSASAIPEPSPAPTPWYANIDKKHLWFDIDIVSHHLDHDESYREKNANLGIEYWFGKDRDYALALGAYRNSEHHTTSYALFNWTPLHYRLLKAGLTTGLANGYPDSNHGRFAPTLLPLVVFEWGPVGLNFTAVPKLGSNINGVEAVQFKFRVDW